MDTLWEDGSPNGQEAENCAKTNMDRKWKDAPCDERNCALCHFPSGMNITMRGLCGSETKIMEGFFDVSYFLKGFINLKPHWRGYGKSHIYFRPRRQVWRLESFYDPVRHVKQTQSKSLKKKFVSNISPIQLQAKRAEFFANDENPYDYWPTGRSKWTINAGICQLTNVQKKLTLTDCIDNLSGITDFTCSDGTCVPMRQVKWTLSGRA